ncbi:GMC family oxidoreductase [Bradyrhizobium sp. CCBAU 51627]|uniref:GMC family oxidoreductase n=1 Tax=Bradyrhizobium sp. CCBAU 51627 TaxID=1325088 RepID=UPI002304E6A6|nr:GMC family oxidoreductase N-terminal domain-containing protein [Bradyrhizobium sp. CCBAU 51627]MDA9433845.1 choline dehydrogenase [Bradyrhizobium sp. CCBAU 51627]
MSEMETFDYIVVGAGSAGCVLANRLSANPKNRVLLLEAGPEDRNLWIHVPLGYGKLFKHPGLNWLYETAPEPQMHERRIAQPRGRVLGGSSSINGLLYVRGQREDFDAWRAAGHVGWGYDDLLPYFIRAEDQQRGASSYHGVGGPLSVSDPTEPHLLCDAFIAAAREGGHPVNPDFNGESQEGAGYYQATARRGRRASSAVAYLRPIRSRKNLKVVTGALARRIIFNARRATGVEWTRKGRVEIASARREIIISAGAINTPQLLQLSGVGDSGRLSRFGIDVVHHLPHVGENFQDHLQARVVYRASKPVTLNDDLKSPLRTLRLGLKYLLQRKGGLTVSAGYAGGFFCTELATDRRPDIQVHFITFSTDAMGTRLHDFSGFTASACQLRPESRGYVRITSPDPSVAPEISANYLGTQGDREAVVSGLGLIRSIMRQPAMAPFVAAEEMPGSSNTSAEELLEYTRRTGGSLYHASCTAALGLVVDDRLRVKGIDGLRVVDASIMPAVISGNTNAGVIAIAEKGADMILERI